MLLYVIIVVVVVVDVFVFAVAVAVAVVDDGLHVCLNLAQCCLWCHFHLRSLITACLLPLTTLTKHLCIP